MYERVVRVIKKNQPVSITGMFVHSYYWLTSPSGDKCYVNPSYKEGQNEKSGSALYFIHGTADFEGAFTCVAEGLVGKKLAEEICSLNLVAFEQRYHGVSIKVFAEQLRDKIKANKHERVCLIAHSRGGLVASYFAEYLAQEANIEVLVIYTIGTPFNGSYLALKPLTLFSDSVNEMAVDSVFLTELKQKIIENGSKNYHFFVADEDAIVPGKAGYIEEYVENDRDSLTALDRHGHLSIMTSGRIVDHIADLLRAYFEPLHPEEPVVTQLNEFVLIDDYMPTPLMPKPSW